MVSCGLVVRVHAFETVELNPVVSLKFLFVFKVNSQRAPNFQTKPLCINFADAWGIKTYCTGWWKQHLRIRKILCFMKIEPAWAEIDVALSTKTWLKNLRSSWKCSSMNFVTLSQLKNEIFINLITSCQIVHVCHPRGSRLVVPLFPSRQTSA